MFLPGWLLGGDGIRRTIIRVGAALALTGIWLGLNRFAFDQLYQPHTSWWKQPLLYIPVLGLSALVVLAMSEVDKRVGRRG